MSDFTYRALCACSALALISIASPAFAQVAAEETESAQEPDPVRYGDTTLLPRLDVGAGAEGTAGTNVVAITREELELKQPTDLQEVFAGEPSIAIGGAIPGTQKIFVNGVDETNLAVTVDGSRQNNKVFHHNGTYLLDPALLKAVTVQPGVAPADAGPGALAGSMGFETVDPIDLLLPGKNFGGFLSGTYDTNSGAYIAGASAYGMVDGFEYLGYLSYANGGNFTAGNGMVMPGTGTNFISGLAKIAYESPEGHRFQLSHEQARDDALRPYRANFYLNIRGEPVLRRYEFDRRNTVFTYEMTKPVGMWDPKVVLAYSQSQVRTPVYDRVTGAILGPADGTTGGFNGKAENKFSFGLGTVTAGFDFYSDRARLDDLTVTPAEFPEERATNVGAYAQARLDTSDRTRVSFGGRIDNQWFTGTDGSRFSNAGLSANASGEIDLIPDFLTFKAGASHVWGGIPLAENFIQNRAWDYGTGPTPVTSNNVTAGLEARYEGFTFIAKGFLSDIHNARSPAYGRPPYTPATAANRTFDLRTWGWEIGAGYEWTNAFVRAKFADVYANVDGVPADSEVGRYLTTPLGQIIMINAGYEFPTWGLTLGAEAEFGLASDRTNVRHPTDPASAKQSLPAYEVLHAFAEYTPPSRQNITLRLDVRNIFNETYTSRASYGQDFVGVVPHFEPGRSFRLNARVKF